MSAERGFPKEKFEKALLHLNQHQPEEALGLLKEAVEAEPGNPWYRSYYGLCLGRLKRFAEAEKHCQAAIDLNLSKAQFYVNMGEVYLLGGHKKLAHRMFTEADKWEKDHPQAKRFLKQMGHRRKPVVPFLDRDHPVNISLGKIRHKLRPAK
jgi:Flp pilus assembly protein TadD